MMKSGSRNSVNGFMSSAFLQENVTHTVRYRWECRAIPLVPWQTHSIQNGISIASSSSETCIRMSCVLQSLKRTSFPLMVSAISVHTPLPAHFMKPYLQCSHYLLYIKFFSGCNGNLSELPSTDFLGRAELPVATIKKEFENKGPSNRRLLLHEVPTGEVLIRLDLQLFDQKTWCLSRKQYVSRIYHCSETETYISWSLVFDHHTNVN